MPDLFLDVLELLRVGVAPTGQAEQMPALFALKYSRHRVDFREIPDGLGDGVAEALLGLGLGEVAQVTADGFGAVVVARLSRFFTEQTRSFLMPALRSVSTCSSAFFANSFLPKHFL